GSADRGEFPFGEAEEFSPVESDGSGDARAVGEEAEHGEEGRCFSGPGLADDTKDFSAVELVAEAAYRGDGLAVRCGGEGDVEVVDAQHGFDCGVRSGGVGGGRRPGVSLGSSHGVHPRWWTAGGDGAWSG